METIYQIKHADSLPKKRRPNGTKGWSAYPFRDMKVMDYISMTTQKDARMAISCANSFTRTKAGTGKKFAIRGKNIYRVK